MRRTLFYLTVALLAFGIGSFVSVKFYLEIPVETITEKTLTKTKLPTQNTTDNTSEIKFSCEDEAIQAVWKRLEKDKDFIADAQSVIKARQIKNCQELFYEPQAVNLNSDKSNEIILKGSYVLFCGSGGDCRTWIVSKINDQYKIIFEGSAAESTESIHILQEKKHKFQSLKIKLNNHWQANTFGFFKFDGSTYRIKKCFKDISSEYDYDDIYPEKLVSTKLKECS